ncbi:MAG: hypothetical protein JNM45_12120 [Rhizobiales bacterium]|nr:hypothetical protein [Hyphomicrobiales bacterium]
MKKIIVSLAAVAALSTAAIASDRPSDLNASGAGYSERIVPVNAAPTGVVVKKTTPAPELPVDNREQRDKSDI